MSTRSILRFSVVIAVLTMTCLPMSRSARGDEADSLKKTLKDEHAEGTDLWIYNDIGKAMAEARRLNKPIFVTFRCVPCADCKAFDAEVAQGNERIEKLAREKFVSIRQVEMKGVDLSLFEFDYDLNWAAMFINADGVVYARYGTQSAAGADAYNSVEGLETTMRRVLTLHERYPADADELKGKRGAKKSYQTALDMPGLQNRDRRRGETTRQNCIHCHNIHDAQNFYAQETGSFSRDMLWRYPLPDNLGLSIDPKNGIRIQSVEADSPADRAGLKAGEDVTYVNGQPITSIADVQWVLHHLPNTETKVEVRGSRTGPHTLKLPAGWKETDVSWRGSLWSVQPRLRVWTPELTPGERRKHGIPQDQSAYLVKWINTDSPGGRSARDSGLKQGDIIIAVDGKALRMTPPQFNAYIKLNYKVGEQLPLTVLRDGRKQQLAIKLVE